MKTVKSNSRIGQRVIGLIYIRRETDGCLLPLRYAYGRYSEAKRHAFCNAYNKVVETVANLNRTYEPNGFQLRIWDSGIIGYNTYEFSFGAVIAVYDMLNKCVANIHYMYITKNNCYYVE